MSIKKILLPALVLLCTACKKDAAPVLPLSDPNMFGDGTYSTRITSNDPAFSESLKKKFGATFVAVYPKLVARFNTNAAKLVFSEVEKDFPYAGAVAVALTGSSKIIYKSDHFTKDDAKDIDVVTHELMHIVQNYPSQSGVPGWVVEGLADYARFIYGVDLAEWKARINHPPKAGENYTDAYGVTARFFVWIEQRLKPGFPEALDKACREGNYNNGAIFTALTGKTVVQLWEEYKKDPALQ